MAVSAAVKDGRLVKSVTRDQYGNPKIADPELADQEWAANTDSAKIPHTVIEARAAAAAMVESGDDDEEQPSALDAELTVTSAAARSKHWEANLRELKYKQAAKELVNAKEYEGQLADVFSHCRTRLLAIPSRCKQALPHLSNADVVVVEDLVREALEELAAGDL